MAPVGRPDRIPVDARARGDLDRLATARGNGPDHPLTGGGDSPVRDPEAVRGPARLHGVASADLPPLPRRQADAEDLARVPADQRIADPFGRTEELPAVRRPGRVEAEAGDAAHRLAHQPHHEDASAVALRTEGD